MFSTGILVCYKFGCSLEHQPCIVMDDNLHDAFFVLVAPVNDTSTRVVERVSWEENFLIATSCRRAININFNFSKVRCPASYCGS